MSQTEQDSNAVQQFKTQLDAVQWLQMQGYKCSRSSFNLHLRQGKIARNGKGSFDAAALLGYAAAHLTPLMQTEDARAREVTLKKLDSDGDLKAVRAARERLKLEKEQGQLMPVARHEEELAARALFFRAEIESFALRKGAELIGLVQGEQSQLHELLLWWAEQTADWMDAWSKERKFAESEDEDSSPSQQDTQG